MVHGSVIGEQTHDIFMTSIWLHLQMAGKRRKHFVLIKFFYRNRNWQFLFCGRKARCAAGRIGALSAGRAASEDDFLFVFGVDFRLFARFPVFVSAAPTRRTSSQRVTVAFYCLSIPRNKGLMLSTGMTQNYVVFLLLDFAKNDEILDFFWNLPFLDIFPSRFF